MKSFVTEERKLFPPFNKGKSPNAYINKKYARYVTN